MSLLHNESFPAHRAGLDSLIFSGSVFGKGVSLLNASLKDVQRRFGEPHVSGELYLGTKVSVGDQKDQLGLVRGVTVATALVRRQVRIVEGRWPGPDEVLVGKLAPAKLGVDAKHLAIGQSVQFEGRPWKVSGVFSAGGSALDSELWCRLPDLQQALKRQDLSLVALLMSGTSTTNVTLFCKERVDLELQAVSEPDYYAAMQRHYKPVRVLAWLVVLLVAGAGVFAGLNMMYGAVAGRIREIATLQAVGYRRRAILLSIVQEGMLLAVAASLMAGGFALAFLNGMAVRFTMGAFALRIDSMAVLVGCGLGLLLGIVGALPPAIKALRCPVAEGLKSV
jgi:ABC-type lipoprotein release transport system permease subunit